MMKSGRFTFSTSVFPLGLTALLPVLAGMLLCAGPGRAAPIILIDENFESYSNLPLAINGLNPGDGNPRNWYDASVGSPTNHVVLGSSFGGSGDNSQLLKVEADDTSTHRARFYRRFPEDAVTLASGYTEVTATFKVHLGSSANDQLIFLGGEATTDEIATVFLSGTNLRYYSAPSPGGSSSLQSTVLSMNTTDWYEITIYADIMTQKWEFHATNLNNPAITASVTDLWFLSDQQTVGSFRTQNRATAGPADFYLDDLLITAIPEPGTLWLLLPAGISLAVCRRRFAA